MNLDTLFFALEIVGTVFFAISGAITAVQKKLDILGTVVLGLVTAVGGGIFRDIILGYLPPAAFRKPVYSITAVIVSAAVFAAVYFAGTEIEHHMDRYSLIINIFDAVGLAIFTVGGVEWAHNCGFLNGTYLCVFVGTVTGVGGGVLRDLMAGKIPVILSKRIYALAAIIGALIYQLLTEYKVTGIVTAIVIGAVSIWVIRLLSMAFRWNLPRIKKDFTESGS